MKLLIILHIGYDLNVANFYLNFIKGIIAKSSHSNDFHVYITHLKSNYINFKNKLPSNVTYEVHEVLNFGADLRPFHEFLMESKEEYDYILKLHTKQFSWWTYRLLSFFLDLDNALAHMEKNPQTGIIGPLDYLQPLYYGVTKEYKTYLSDCLRLFTEKVDPIDINYLKLLNNLYDNQQSEHKFCPKKYFESREDLFDAKLFSPDQQKHHALTMRFNEFNHMFFNDCLNDSKFMKFIAGTMFIMRGKIVKELQDEKLSVLESLYPKYETITYYSNFDHNGTVVRHTNAMEYVLQASIYSLGYTCYGWKSDNFNDFSQLYLSSPLYPEVKAKQITHKTKKSKNILFFTNELSSTGAPLVLMDLIKRLKLEDTYNIYLLAYNGGDNQNAFEDLCGKEQVFLFQNENRKVGMGCFESLVSLTKHLCDKLDIHIMYINTLVGVASIYGAFDGKRRIILHVHEATNEILNLYSSNIIIGYEYLTLVDDVIFVNSYLKQMFESNYEISETTHFHTIYNDITIDSTFSGQKLYEDKRLRDNLIFGGVGSINERKGFDIFLRLAQRYQKHYFVWCSNESYGLPLPANMQIVCYPKEKMVQFYKSIDWMLYVSRSEAFPLSFYECILCETKIIASEQTLPLNHDLALSTYIKQNPNVVLDKNFSSVQLFEAYLDSSMIRETKYKETSLDEIKLLISGNVTKLISIIKNDAAKNPMTKRLPLPIEFELVQNVTSYLKFKTYGNSNHDLASLSSFSNINNNLQHFLNHGFSEGRQLYAFPCLLKPKVLFVLHTLGNNGATKVGLDIAMCLQWNFDVIICSWENGSMIDLYNFKNKPIIIGLRDYEHCLVKYLDRYETACSIIDTINPDLIYVNCSVAHDFYHAAVSKHRPCIYHHHEGPMGYECELQGSQIPSHTFFQSFSSEKTKFYSASSATTNYLRDVFEIEDDITQFQYTNLNIVDEKCNNIENVIKREGRILIGMCGENSFRKGFDIFIELSHRFPQYDFCWVGVSNDKEELKCGYYVDNLILIERTNNPYGYINQFDSFLCTSREEIYGLVILESLYLKKHTFFMKSGIDSWREFENYGAHAIDGESSYDSWKSFISKHELLPFTAKGFLNIDFKNIFAKYIGSIKNDIIELVKGDVKIHDCSINTERDLYYDDEYGYITYDAGKVQAIIDQFHKNKFDLAIYKRKYKDLRFANDEEYVKHWQSSGHKYRSCVQDDWKLLLDIKKDEMFAKGIFDKNELDQDEYKSIEVYFDETLYRNKYSDLKDLPDVKEHYYCHGIYEPRSAYSLQKNSSFKLEDIPEFLNNPN